MLNWPWCLLASRAVFQSSWLLWGCSGTLWCWVNGISHWWDTCSLLVLPWWTFASGEGADGLSLLRAQSRVRVFTGCSTGRFCTSRFCVRAASLGTCAAVCRSSAGLRAASYLNCSICLNTTLCCVTLQGSELYFCIETSQGLILHEGKHSNDKKRYSQKKELCVIYSLQICRQSFESSHIMLRVTDVTSLVFSEDPSISVVKEK